MDRMKKDQDAVLATYKRLPVEVAKGEGVYLYDIYGKRYLDFASGIAVNALGYGHEKIQKAIEKQAKQFLHLSNYFVSPTVAELATRLKQHSFAQKIFFSNSGTEANEAMIKLSRKWGRGICESKTKIIAIKGGFHGRTMGAMSLMQQAKHHKDFAPLMPDVVQVEVNDIEGLMAAASKDVCGIVFELIQGEAGVVELSKNYVKAIERMAKEINALVLVDEIQTGLMRTGTLFAYEQYNLRPDVMTLSKALGGGLPLGAMLVGSKAEKVFETGDHGSTFGGNPLAAAAGCAVMGELLKEGFKEKVNDVSNHLIEGLQALKSRHADKVRSLSGKGLMIGIHVGEHAEKVRAHCLKEGVVLNVTSQEILRLLPPLIIEKEHVDELLVCIENALLDL